MKKTFFFVLLCTFSLKISAQQVQFKYPVIKSGGGIVEVPEAEPIADLKMSYKIVAEIANGSEKPDSMNANLEKLARLVNLHHHAGVSASNFELVIVIHFTATPIVLSDEAYKKKFGVPNPNTALLNEMAAAGVRLYVCGQSIHRRKLVNEERNPNIKVILSAMVGITTLQMKGYAFMQ